MLLTGLCGVGKTVLLNEIEHIAKEDGYRTIFIEAHENKAFGLLIGPHLRSLLFELNRISGVGNKVRRGLTVLRSFNRNLKLACAGRRPTNKPTCPLKILKPLPKELRKGSYQG